MRLPILILLIATLVRILGAFVSPPVRRITQRTPTPLFQEPRVYVFMLSTTSQEWVQSVQHLVSSASSAIRVTVILECVDAEDAQEAPSHLKPYTTLLHILKPIRADDEQPLMNRLRTLLGHAKTRRIPHGSLLVFMDVRLRMVSQWDAVLSRASMSLSDAVITCPDWKDSNGRAGFPTLRTASTGRAKREASKPVHHTALLDFTHAVCACPEFMATRHATLFPSMDLSSVRSCVHLFTQVELKKMSWVVPCFPLFQPAPSRSSIEEEWLDEDDGCADHTITAWSRAGLTRLSKDKERILKFGSAEVAKRAVRLQR